VPVTFFYLFGIYLIFRSLETNMTGITLENIYDVVTTYSVADTQFTLPLEQFEGLVRLYEHNII